MSDLPELKDILVIIHLFGVAMGAGGAFMSIRINCAQSDTKPVRKDR